MPELFAPSATCATFHPKCSPIASQSDRCLTTAKPNVAPKRTVFSWARLVTLGFAPCKRANTSEVSATAPVGPSAHARKCKSKPRMNSSSPTEPMARNDSPASRASRQSNRTCDESRGVHSARPQITFAPTSSPQAAAPSSKPRAAPETPPRQRPSDLHDAAGWIAIPTIVMARAPASKGTVFSAIKLSV